FTSFPTRRSSDLPVSPRAKIEHCSWGNLFCELVFLISSGRDWSGSSRAPLPLATLLVPLVVARNGALGPFGASPRAPACLRCPSTPDACYPNSSGDYGPLGRHPSDFLDHCAHGPLVL